METRKATADTLVGLFVILGIVLINLVTFVIRDDIFVDTMVVRVRFESVSGLEVGAPVLVSGIRAGRVSRIDYEAIPPRTVLDPEGEMPPQPVVVSMVIKKEVPVYNDARVRLVQQGFIGDKRVEIDPGTVNAGLFEEKSPPIAGEAQFDMEQAMRKAGLIVDDLQATTASFREFVTDDENIQRMSDTLESLNASVRKVNAYLARNEESVAEAVEDLPEITENLKTLSTDAKRFVEEGGRADQFADETRRTIQQLANRIEETNTRLQATIEDMNEAIRNADERSGKITDSAVSFLEETETDFDALAQSLRETSDNLNEVIQGIQRGEGTVGRLMTDPQPFEDLKRAIEALHGFLIGEPTAVYNTEVPYGMSRGEQPEPGSPNE